MTAEIITIGDEILIGQIVDSNSTFIAKSLNKIGISVYQITSIQDDREHILKTLEDAQKRVDIVIMTGGLGPTKDDITKNTLASFFNDTLVKNSLVEDHIKDIWKKYIKQPLLQVNLDQALVPSKATILMNNSGTAPGLWMEKNDTVFISLPGVPFEMKTLMANEVLPRLSKSFKLPYIIHRTILTYGMGESVIASRIANWEDNLPNTIKLAYLPNLGRVRLRLSSKGYDKLVLQQSIQEQIDTLLPQISDIFVGFEEDDSIEQIIGNKLVKLGKTLAIAESCTGGMLSSKFTTHSGASAYFVGGVVAYDTKIKSNILGVSDAIIQKYSVVSTQVAEAMAKGIQKQFNSDYAISTSGNAGPAKGDSDAEIGTVYIAIATPTGVFSEHFVFGKQRERVVIKAVHMALTMMQKEIFKN